MVEKWYHNYKEALGKSEFDAKLICHAKQLKEGKKVSAENNLVQPTTFSKNAPKFMKLLEKFFFQKDTNFTN